MGLLLVSISSVKICILPLPVFFFFVLNGGKSAFPLLSNT